MVASLPPVPDAGRPAPASGGGRLPSGRHGLTREVVVASQRGRLLDAMADVVAEKGYGGTTVGDVVERAGVSRRTFYEVFPDKETCFLAAYDLGLEVMLARVLGTAAALRGVDWRRRARASMETYVEVLTHEPAFAWCFHVEVLGAGPRALERRAANVLLFAKLWKGLHDDARREDPSLLELPDEVFVALTAGSEEMIREHLRRLGVARLPELVEPLWGVVLAILGQRAGRPSVDV